MTKNLALSRRALLSALPVSGVALTLPATAAPIAADPVLPLYREWLAAGDACERVAAMPDWDMDNPEFLAADTRHDAAWSALADVTPTSPAGIAALMHVLWELDGPAFLNGTPDYEMEVALPTNVVVAAVWRGASGLDGTPRALEVDDHRIIGPRDRAA